MTTKIAEVEAIPVQSYQPGTVANSVQLSEGLRVDFHAILADPGYAEVKSFLMKWLFFWTSQSMVVLTIYTTCTSSFVLFVFICDLQVLEIHNFVLLKIGSWIWSRYQSFFLAKDWQSLSNSGQEVLVYHSQCLNLKPCHKNYHKNWCFLAPKLWSALDLAFFWNIPVLRCSILQLFSFAQNGRTTGASGRWSSCTQGSLIIHALWRSTET